MLNIDKFRGMRWQVDEFRLGHNYATEAHDVWLGSTGLDPMRYGAKRAEDNTVDFRSVRTFFQYDDKLITTNSEENAFVKSPTVGDNDNRLYFLHNGSLQYYRESDVPAGVPTNLDLGHKLGVDAPESQVVGGFGDTTFLSPVTNIGYGNGSFPGYYGPDIYEVVFVFTYVTDTGEEGPPSVPTITRYAKSGETKIFLIGFTPTTNPRIIGARVYMASTDRAYFRLAQPDITVAGVPNITLSKDDFASGITFTVNREANQDLLVSEEWYPPPTGLKHFAGLDNGISVAADEHTLYYNVPYLMHAWPLRYRKRIGDKIRAVAKIDGGHVVLTDNKAHLFMGTDPDYMTEVPINFNHACPDPRSVVEIDNGVAWATHEGIAFLSANNARIITDGFIDRVEWLKRVDINNFRTEMYEGRIICMTRDESGNPIGYVFNLVEQEITSFTINEYSLNSGFHRDPHTNQLWYITDSQGMAIFNEGSQRRTKWISGKIELPGALSLCAGRAEIEDYIPEPHEATLKIEAENRYQTKSITDNKPFYFEPTGRKRWMRIGIEAQRKLSLLRIGRQIGEV